MRWMLGTLSVGCMLAACVSSEEHTPSGTAGSGGSAGSADAAAGSAGFAGGAGASGADSGGGSGGSAGSSSAPPECASAQDCTVHSDCCSCQSLGPGEPLPPACDKTCTVDVCATLGDPPLECIAGRCVVGASCDASKVTCSEQPPVCTNGGEAPTVISGCWATCLSLTECAEVTGCESCDASQACVRYQTELGTSVHCVSVPAQCETDRTCACMGSSVCLHPYSTCTDLSSVQALGCS